MRRATDVDEADDGVIAWLHHQGRVRFEAWIGNVGSAHFLDPRGWRAWIGQSGAQIIYCLAIRQLHDCHVMQRRPFVEESELGETGGDDVRCVELEVLAGDVYHT